MSSEQRKAYGCVFCLTGREWDVADRIERVRPGIHATAAVQEKQVCPWQEEQASLSTWLNHSTGSSVAHSRPWQSC